MPDRISDERIDTLASALRGAQSDVYAVVAAIKSQRARADAAERLAEDRRLANEAVRTAHASTLEQEKRHLDRLAELVTDRDEARLWAEWLAVERVTDRDEAQCWAEWLAAERDSYRRGAEHLGRMVNRAQETMLDITGLHELIGADGDGDWLTVWEKLAEFVAERDALKARIEAVREMHRRIPIWPMGTPDCIVSEHDLIELGSGEQVCTHDGPEYYACEECRFEDGTWIEWPCATIRALDGEAVDR